MDVVLAFLSLSSLLWLLYNGDNRSFLVFGISFLDFFRLLDLGVFDVGSAVLGIGILLFIFFIGFGVDNHHDFRLLLNLLLGVLLDDDGNLLFLNFNNLLHFIERALERRVESLSESLKVSLSEQL